MGSSGRATDAPTRPCSLGWPIAAALIVFVTVVVNITMVYFAIKSSTGLVTENYYERGQSFSTRSDMKFFESNFSDRLKMIRPEKIFVGQTFDARLVLEEGSCASALFSAFRPADAKYDFEFELLSDDARSCVGSVVFPLKGFWDIIVDARDSDGAVFRLSESIYVFDSP